MYIEHIRSLFRSCRSELEHAKQLLIDALSIGSYCVVNPDFNVVDVVGIDDNILPSLRLVICKSENLAKNKLKFRRMITRYQLYTFLDVFSFLWQVFGNPTNVVTVGNDCYFSIAIGSAGYRCFTYLCDVSEKDKVLSIKKEETQEKVEELRRLRELYFGRPPLISQIAKLLNINFGCSCAINYERKEIRFPIPVRDYDSYITLTLGMIDISEYEVSADIPKPDNIEMETALAALEVIARFYLKKVLVLVHDDLRYFAVNIHDDIYVVV